MGRSSMHLSYQSQMRARAIQHKRRARKRRLRRFRALILLLLIVLIGWWAMVAVRDAKDAATAGQLAQGNQLSAGGQTAPKGEAWQLLLVNGSNPRPEEAAAPTLAQVGRFQVDSRIADSLTRMLADAEAAGLSPLICSAYRTHAFQTELFEEQVQKWLDEGYTRAEAEKEARTVVAYPGTSEHEIGLAVDIVSQSYQLLDDAQAETPEAKWLKEHCAEYGFILRYPTDKTEITGIIFEPWHYRYVGEEAAREIMERGICLEEYLAE